MNRIELGQWIHDRRKSKGLKQKEFVKITGYNLTTVSKAENGHDKISLTALTNIVQALGGELQFDVKEQA